MNGRKSAVRRAWSHQRDSCKERIMLQIQSPQLWEACWSPASWNTSSSGLTPSSSQNTNRQAAVMQQHVQRHHLDTNTTTSTLTPKVRFWVGQVWILQIQLLPACPGQQAGPALLRCAHIPHGGLIQSTSYRPNVASTARKSCGNRTPGHIWQSSAWTFGTFGSVYFQSLQIISLNVLLHVVGAGFGFPCTLCSQIHATSSV